MEPLKSPTEKNFLTNSILSRSPIIRVQGEYKFSRGPDRTCDSILKYDESTETLSKALILSQIDWAVLNRRHRDLTNSDSDFRWAEHAPYRIIEGMDLGGRENVFMIFPFAYGVNAKSIQEVSGIELVEFTEQIVSRVVAPGIRLGFENSREIIHELNRLPPACAIYMYALLHELGHYLGPYSLADVQQEEIYQHMTGSELFADLYAFHMLQEIRPVILLQMMMRLFWYLPKGDIHNDSDVAVSYYFINQLLEAGVLKVNGNKLYLEISQLGAIYAFMPTDESISEFVANLEFYKTKLQGVVDIIFSNITELPKGLV